MSQFPSVLLNYTDDNQPTVVIDNNTFSSWGDVVTKVGNVAEAENALIVARMLTHFSYRSRYKVIGDPAVYEAALLKRISTEPVVEPVKGKVTRSQSFGIPDFSTIFAPQITNDQLVFFVYDAALYVPYKVEAVPTESDIAKQKYTPLPLTRVT